jgi:UDP:flavonoid glycosyltransferase YjiC (YdhE family)
MYQAPRLNGKWPKGHLAISHAEILGLRGYLDYHRLKGCLLAWRALFEALSPDLLVADYAPTAIIAAKLSQLPSVAIGDGFVIPPDRDPLPSLQPWRNIPQAVLRSSENAVRDSLNILLREFEQPPIARLAQVFQGDTNLLCTLPELDHFGERRNLSYQGVHETTVSNQIPQWPKGSGAKLFVYLPAQHKQLAPLVNAIRKSGFPTVLYIKDLPAEAKTLINGGCCRLYEQPVHLGTALQNADLVITHGGHGTCAASLLAGTKMLTLPTSLEQHLLAYRLSQAGLLTSWASAKEFNPDLAIQTALKTTRVKKAVSRFSIKYGQQRPADPANNLYATILNNI